MTTRLGYLVDCTADTIPVVKGASSNTLESIANAAGYLTNDGAGTFSWSATAAIATPGTLTVATVNSAAGAHTHAITTSANPGAAASILASDANGYLQLVRLGLGVAPTHRFHVQDTVAVGKTVQVYTNAGETGPAGGLWMDQQSHSVGGVSGPELGFSVDGTPLWAVGMDYDQVDFALVYSYTLNADIIYVDTVGTVGIGDTGASPGAQVHIVNPATRDYPALMVVQNKTTQPVIKGYVQTGATGNGIEIRNADTDVLQFYVNGTGVTTAHKYSATGVSDTQQLTITGYTTQAVATPLVGFTRDDATAGVSAMLGLTCLGSGANGDGGSIPLAGKTSTTAAQSMGLLAWQWVDATHASRKSKLGLSAYDTAVRLGLEIEATGVGVTTKTFGGQLCKVTDVNDTYTVLSSDYVLSCSKATPFTVTLPAAVVGQVYIFKNYGAGNVTITAPGVDTFDEVDSDIILTQYDSMTLICRAANAWVIA